MPRLLMRSLRQLKKLRHAEMAYLMDLSSNYFQMTLQGDAAAARLDVRAGREEWSIDATGLDRKLYDLVSWLRLVANWIAGALPEAPGRFDLDQSLQLEVVEKVRRIRAIRVIYRSPAMETASEMDVSADAKDVRVFASEIQRETAALGSRSGDN
jgi:hypothetical protein